MGLKTIDRAPRAQGLSRTLVLLHGYGADEHDLLPLAHELDPRLRVVSLQAPLSLGGSQRAWFNLVPTPQGFAFDPKEVKAGQDAAIAAVEEIAKQSPDPILLGFSQGAGMALGVMLQRPKLVRAVISFSGVMRMLETAPERELRGKPVFAAHGEYDPLVPLQHGHEVHDQLTKLGLDVTWREYPMGHMVIPEELDAAREWLKAWV
jgi:phospholipase/carboxylesterase